jgi:hypothetical protein
VECSEEVGDWERDRGCGVDLKKMQRGAWFDVVGGCGTVQLQGRSRHSNSAVNTKSGFLIIRYGCGEHYITVHDYNGYLISQFHLVCRRRPVRSAADSECVETTQSGSCAGYDDQTFTYDGPPFRRNNTQYPRLSFSIA